MSLKMKLTASISAFFLVVGLMLIGIMAVNQATVNMGGSISFTATDVYARVTGKIENAQGEYANKELPTLEFSAENDTPDQSGWSNLNLLFDDDATPIVIKVTVENLSAQNTLRVNLNDTLSSTIENFEKVVKNDGEDYTNQTDITLQPNGQENDSTTFTITMSVTNKNNSVTADFDYELNLFDQYYVEPYDYFTFKENGDGTVELTAFDKEKAPSTDIVIPATVSQNESGQWTEGNTYTVTAIANGSYNNSVFYNSGLTSITLPSNLTNIGDYAFQQCSGLTGALDLSNCTSLRSIGYYAFRDCSGLESITLPSSLEAIGDYAFDGCDNLQPSVTDSQGVKYLGNNENQYLVLWDGTDITTSSYTVNENCKIICYRAFSNCTSLTSIDLSNCTSLTSIGNYAFSGCSGLTEVDLSNCTSLTSIGNNAFFNCDGLTSITLSSSLTSIGSSAFSGCYGLTSITLPSSLESIGNFAFLSCYALAEVYNYSNLRISDNGTNGAVGMYAKVVYNLSDGEDKPEKRIQTIDDVQYYVYGDDFIALAPSVARDSLTAHKLDIGATEINPYAFSSCSGLTEVDLSNCTSLTSIGEYAFNSCSELTSIDLSKCTSLTSIGEYAFSGCSGLTSITLPSSLTSIERNTFSSCRGLTEVDLSNCTSLKSIGSSAFFNCSGLTSITLPSSLTSIGSSAFIGCSGLTTIRIEATTPPTLDSIIPSNATIEVPSASVGAYKSASDWLSHASKIVGY